MRRFRKFSCDRLPSDPDEKTIAEITAAIRASWTKSEESNRLRFDHRPTEFRVPMISTLEIGQSAPPNY